MTFSQPALTAPRPRSLENNSYLPGDLRNGWQLVANLLFSLTSRYLAFSEPRSRSLEKKSLSSSDLQGRDRNVLTSEAYPFFRATFDLLGRLSLHKSFGIDWLYQDQGRLREIPICRATFGSVTERFPNRAV